VHGNNRLEIIWTAIPLAIVIGLFVVSTVVLTRVEAKTEEPAVVLDVSAYRFGWTFNYKDPGSFVAQNEPYADLWATISSSPSEPSSDQPRDPAQDVVLPVGQPVLFRLKAEDVIHSFYVPAFFFKRDAIPGRINEFEVTIEEPGRYGGQCAEFCGLNHGQMFFNIRAVEPAEYEAWLAENAAEGEAPADQAAQDTVAVGDAQPSGTPGEAAPGDEPLPSAEASPMGATPHVEMGSIESSRGVA
jgi:cytochrome c oxidase subunit 2